MSLIDGQYAVRAGALRNASTPGVPVTVDNFIRAETDLYFSVVALKEGGFGKFEHHRELAPIDTQTVIRMNRDALYSAAVFDLEAGPVAVTLPDAGKRFMSMQVIDEDEFWSWATRGQLESRLVRPRLGLQQLSPSQLCPSTTGQPLDG